MGVADNHNRRIDLVVEDLVVQPVVACGRREVAEDIVDILGWLEAVDNSEEDIVDVHNADLPEVDAGYIPVAVQSVSVARKFALSPVHTWAAVVVPEVEQGPAEGRMVAGTR